MCKSCDNCFWRLGRKNLHCHFNSEVPEDNVCSCHDYTCEECKLSCAEYMVHGKKLCRHCMVIEAELEDHEVTMYFRDGEYLGDSDNFEEVVCQLYDVKELD